MINRSLIISFSTLQTKQTFVKWFPCFGNRILFFQINTAKSPPVKLKHLWLFLTWPSRAYRKFEWWCISKFLQTKDIKRERVTLRLHEMYKQQKELALLYYFRDLALTTKVEEQVSELCCIISGISGSGFNYQS